MRYAWMDEAACREVGTEPFFAETDNELIRVDYRAAKKICARCPVVDACLDYALELNIAYGVFGGLTERERRAVRRRRTAA
jgi:WhiB family transcriptional regulator, redox-sensing transcriptional regulator